MKSLKVWGLIVTLLGIAIVITSCVLSTKFENATTARKETTTSAETECSTTNTNTLTEEERTLWAKVLFCEGATLNDEAVTAQASVMYNHIGKYGDDITTVLTRPNAFYGYNAIDKAEGVDLTRYYNIIDDIWTNGPSIPKNVVLFGWEHTFDSFGEAVELYAVIDGVYFFSFAEGYH